MSMMEEADAVDLSKENIQPLKQGRNASQLGLALQAQSDEQIHQMLHRMQEAYEVKIRSYSGSDPLELWVEYISWVEQSFPKHGIEGNLGVLLQKCFTALKDEERYKQDLRFVKLWIKFIEMQTTDRLELYRFLSGQGIGTACAEFYRSWADEFEQMEDYKHAEAVYQLAYNNIAQPREELEAAHTQFQLRFARAAFANQLNNVQETAHSADLENQRSAMAALCPVGPKQNKVPIVRVGQNVLSAHPGSLPTTSSSNRTRSSLLGPSNAIRSDRIQVYQEDSSDSVNVLGKGRSQASSSSVHGFRNKENTLDPGKWNKPGAVQTKILPQAAAYMQPTGPVFEVHRDEAAAVAPNTPSLKTFTPSVLKPRKLEENSVKDTLAVFEQSDPSVRVMYPKDKVYGGGKELQLEEIMALEYWQEKAASSGCLVDPVEQERRRLEEMRRHIDRQLKLLSRKPLDPQSVPEEVETSASSCQSGAPAQSSGLEAVDSCTASTIRSESKEAHSIEHQNNTASSAKVDSRNTASPYGLLSPGDAPVISANNSNASELSVDRKKVAFGSGNRGHTSIYNQSITVHTKLVMNEMEDLWRSPNPVKYIESPVVVAKDPVPLANHVAFDICRDETDVIRPPQSNAHAPTSTGLKGITPSVLSDRRAVSKNVLSSQPQHGADHFRVMSDDAEESLAHALGPDTSSACGDIFKEPMAAPLRGSLKTGPTEKVALVDNKRGQVPSENVLFENRTFVSQRKDSIVTSSVQDSIAAIDPNKLQQAESSQPITNPSVVNNQEKQRDSNDFQIFVPEVEKDPMTGFEFNVFVDEQEKKASAPVESTSNPIVAPTNKFNIIAKEKENAQKFSLVEFEEIEQRPKVAPPRRSILPQLNTQVNMCPAKNFIPKMDRAPQLNDEDDTCSTKVFSRGFLVASTPFTAAVTRDKAPGFGFVPSELDGSIFVTQQPDEMVPPSGISQNVPVNGIQLDTIYEVSSSSTRTSSSQSAVSGTGTVSSGITEHEGAFVSTQPNLNIIDEDNEDLSENFVAPYHQDVTICLNGEVDPFDTNLAQDLLEKNNFPKAHHKDGLYFSTKPVPTKRNDNFAIEGENFKIIKQMGEGAYAKVWHVVEESTNRHVALKIQKPSWVWEYYICREIQQRLGNQNLASSFMTAEKIFVFKNGSVLLTELIPYGSLLDLANKLTQQPSFAIKRESIVIMMADHLLRLVEALHSCNIIHADLKPDNVMIRSMPNMGSLDSCLTLVDFGRSIDMSLFPSGTTFQQNVKTDGFSCVEMQTNRPWTYQTDLYGLASCVHCLLFGDYMKVREIDGRWHIHRTIPRACRERWTKFFCSLLNVESCDAIPNLASIREELLCSYSLTLHDFESFQRLF